MGFAIEHFATLGSQGKGKGKWDDKDFPGGPGGPCNAGGFPVSLDSKESACSEGDPGSIPGLEDSLEKGMAV